MKNKILKVLFGTFMLFILVIVFYITAKIVQGEQNHKLFCDFHTNVLMAIKLIIRGIRISPAGPIAKLPSCQHDVNIM